MSRTAGRGLPDHLTSFVGRVAETAALAAAVEEHRLVTASGPGGVGKTRLSVAVAARLAGDHLDGAAFIDLVSVTDDALVIPAVADALGVPERAGLHRADALLAALADAECLLVLDNCEHVLAGARTCVTRLLEACPAVRVLATSRTRLMVAGEFVYPVPGLSLTGHAGGDAIDLFCTRMTAAGAATPSSRAELDLVAGICASLDGIALAIELAAARAASFGLDGLHRALGESHAALEVEHRHDDRHRSLSAAIDWSYELLGDDDRFVLRAAAVFAASFDLDAAAAVIGRPPVPLLGALGRLVDSSLLTLRPGLPTRYRMLETIRQRASELATAAGELDDLRRRHLRWCRVTLDGLAAQPSDDGFWCDQVDRVVDDARAALGWAVARRDPRLDAAGLAAVLATILFTRGRPGEAQARFEQAAELSSTSGARHDALLAAAGAALARYAGEEATALLSRAAAVAVGAGNPEQAALDLARRAAVWHRHAGTMSRQRTTEETEATLAECARLAGDSPRVRAAVAVANICRNDMARTRRATLEVVDLARATGNPLWLDAALDQVCALELESGDRSAASEVVRTRQRALAHVPIDVHSAMDHADANLMAVHIGLACGRIHEARQHAAALAALPFLREEPHVPLARQLEVEALAGDVALTQQLAARWELAWRQSGRPRVNSHGPAAYAVAMTYGMLGDDEGRRRWVEITRSLLHDDVHLDEPANVWPAAFDAFLALHRGDADEALARLGHDADAVPERISWHQALWLPWYAAAWAEASMLAGLGDLDDRLARAARVAHGNDVALAVIDRSRALHRGDVDLLAEIAARCDAAGSSYQAARTRRHLDMRASAGAQPRAPKAFASLSARELDVLRLLAAGRSNPEIAAALYISRKTAEHHVSSILAKLGLTRRSEAAALAGRLQLLEP